MQIALHPKQKQVWDSPATEILYGGAAGGGKSHLLRALSIILCGQVPGLQVYLFRRIFPDLIKNHMHGPKGYPVMLAEWINQGLARIVGETEIKFWNGSRIMLCHCQHEKNVYGYQGAEIHVLLMDELTHFTKFMYTFLRGRVRAIGLQTGGIKIPRIVCASNPGNIGHNWVYADFVEPKPAMEIWQALPKDGGMVRQFIPARIRDNPSLMEDDPTYADRLEGLGNPALVKAMKDGDWNIVAGGMFDDLWAEDKHVVPPFEIPFSWRIDRTFDWGSSHPFSVTWWAESDGSRIELPRGVDGQKRVINWPRGSVVALAEWYGWNGKPNEGSRMLASEIARGIVERERTMKLAVTPGCADSSIFDVQNGRSIADDMSICGVTWTKADKSPGSRKAGAEIIRRMLKSGLRARPEEPCLYFFSSCRNLIRTLPRLPRDPKNPDDVDTDAEDHPYDTARYRLQSKVQIATQEDMFA